MHAHTYTPSSSAAPEKILFPPGSIFSWFWYSCVLTTRTADVVQPTICRHASISSYATLTIVLQLLYTPQDMSLLTAVSRQRIVFVLILSASPVAQRSIKAESEVARSASFPNYCMSAYWLQFFALSLSTVNAH